MFVYMNMILQLLCVYIQHVCMCTCVYMCMYVCVYVHLEGQTSISGIFLSDTLFFEIDYLRECAVN